MVFHTAQTQQRGVVFHTAQTQQRGVVFHTAQTQLTNFARPLWGDERPAEKSLHTADTRVYKHNVPSSSLYVMLARRANYTVAPTLSYQTTRSPGPPPCGLSYSEPLGGGGGGGERGEHPHQEVREVIEQ